MKPQSEGLKHLPKAAARNSQGSEIPYAHGAVRMSDLPLLREVVVRDDGFTLRFVRSGVFSQNCGQRV